jgi:hypothetical protein
MAVLFTVLERRDKPDELEIIAVRCRLPLLARRAHGYVGACRSLPPAGCPLFAPGILGQVIREEWDTRDTPLGPLSQAFRSVFPGKQRFGDSRDMWVTS